MRRVIRRQFGSSVAVEQLVEDAIPPRNSVLSVTNPCTVLDGLATVVFDRFVDQIDPSRSLNYAQVRKVKKLYGRWLAWRRLYVGLDNAKAIEHVGVQVQALVLLEVGLGDARLLTEEQCRRLSYELAGANYKTEEVLTIIWGALGLIDEIDQDLLAQVMRDLHLCERDVIVSASR